MLIYNNFEQKTLVPNMRGLGEVQKETNMPYLERTLHMKRKAHQTTTIVIVTILTTKYHNFKKQTSLVTFKEETTSNNDNMKQCKFYHTIIPY
jgi:hypothetical protein